MIELLSIALKHSNIILNSIFIGAFILNLLFAFTIIFMERRSANSIWAWLLVLVFLPLFGFILYLLLGRQIQRDQIFKIDKEDKKGLELIVDEQLAALKNENFSNSNYQIVKFKEMIQMLLYNNAAFLTTDNDLKIYTDGQEKFDDLIQDIRNATDYIHFQYYIIQNDELGRTILNELGKKAEQGVEVKILYDDMGSRGLRKKGLRPFRNKGGHAEAFFPSKLPLINLRMNNRNHRKIVVIDGQIGYVGGFNVGDEYLGKSKKFGYWRDTHLRIVGDAVNALQLRFILDWNSQATRDHISYDDRYFPDVNSGGTIGVQIASSGPDEEWEQIKYGYLKMISSAKKSIYIQSPYFIPDQAFLDSIKIAALGGVDVNIMIPNKPDHPFVFWATLKNAASLLDAGVKVFHYDNGFLHSKTLVIDDEIASVGTANMDHRSFTLNFEVNAFIYDQQIAKKYMESIHQNDYTGHDIAHVYRVTALAKSIAENEGVNDTLVIELACLLHDTVDEKVVDANKQYVELKSFLSSLSLSTEDQEHILFIINNMSYRNGKNDHVTLSLEGQIVRDADRLDAIGAIGVARTFQFAGHFGEPMWTEHMSLDKINDDLVEQLPPSAIKHFFEKLLKLESLMHTDTAKMIAKERHDFMMMYLKQFFTEWNCHD